MLLLVLMAVFGVIVGAIAQSKGRDLLPWFVYGALFFAIALIHILLIRPAVPRGSRRCPTCAEVIRNEAKVCAHCGHRFLGADASRR